VRVERLSLSDVEAAGGPEQVARRLGRLVATPESVVARVREIVSEVRLRGDAAVLEFTRTYDTAGAPPPPLVVPGEELDAAIKQLPRDVVAGLQVAMANVAEVAQAGVGEDVSLTLPQRQRVTLREIPVGSAAVYVPGGRAAYPSTAVMGVVTARAAGVMDVVVCSPPGPGGQIDKAILGTCRLLGVERVYRMGGAQAIAALAFGTATVRRVDVIVGPGNLYVQAAKRDVAGVVGIDGFAGPSDLLAVIGADADPRMVALDLLAQGEHGAGTLVAAASSSLAVLDAVARELERLDGERPATAVQGAPAAQSATSEGATSESATSQSATSESATSESATYVLIELADARAGVALANAFAPEHLQLVGAEPEALAPLVRAAGCLLVGAASATAFSDYVAGSNHILPTGGAARFASGLSTRHFRRRMPVVRIDPAGAAKLAAAGAPIARAEGFEWHARSMEARIGDNQVP
jgi:histidinol dehydrogenase